MGLFVSTPVTPRITYLNNQTASELQEQVTLTCEASGEPTPAITWSFGPRVFTEREQVLTLLHHSAACWGARGIPTAFLSSAEENIKAVVCEL